MTTDELKAILAAATKGPWTRSAVGLTNEGQRPVTSKNARVALVDCQAEIPRKHLWQSECAEREANAHLIAVATDLAAEVIRLREALAELKSVAQRAVDLSAKYGDFKLYAMEPMEQAIADARAALAQTGGGVMTDAAKPAWLGVTVYLVTTNDPEDWVVYHSFDSARLDWEDHPMTDRVWECQMGQTPVDVTPKEAN